MDYLLQVLAITLGFIVQTVFGFAASVIAYPVLLLQTTLPSAVALMSVFYALFSIVQVKQNWKLIDRKIIKEMLSGILFGLIVGVALLKYTDPLILKRALGFFILAFVAYSLWKKKKIKIFNKMGFAFGFGGGFFGGLFAAGGPPLVVYTFNKLDDSKKVRATIIGGLAIINFLRAPLLVGGNILTKEILLSSFYLLPFFFLSLYLGQKLYSRLNEETFKKILLFLLGLVGVDLIL